ncbi:hypothetical protein SNE40_008808 [Patella caerulea]|uniref:Alpha-L-iduronidase n=1 Tax=Patella caerulea TaxID=87958 RepID=A0AAN8JMW5_PATCE
MDFLAIILLALCVQVKTQSEDISLKVSSDDVRGPFQHFWRSTGFCPPDPHQEAHAFDLSNDMLQNLAYIGAVPHRGIEQVRIHWLLDLVTVSGYSSGSPVYNFTYLDQLLQQLYINGLKPGFEVMGNPSNIFTDFENKTQVYMWRDFIKLVASRYITMFGLDYVKTWNFENWNEPNCQDFDMNITLQGFANYYDATSEGLMAANSDLIFGGPGGGCDDLLLKSHHHGKYDEFLFNHVVNGTNYFTGKTGVRMDFISLHRKGNGKSVNVLLEEVASMKAISEKYPTLANKPFYNDESDPMVGWSKDLPWRADAIYGAMAVKIIAQHQNIFVANPDCPINYQLLSYDNGFLSYYPHQFTQRTLLARFQMNNTKQPYTTFIQKPIYGTMCMLSLLGEQQVFVGTGGDVTQPIRNDTETGALATVHIPTDNTTSDSWQMSLLIYDSDDSNHGTSYGELDLDWYINPPDPTQELMLVGYVVSGLSNDPYGVWTGLYNKTDYPTPKQFQFLRTQEGVGRVAYQPVKPGPGKVILPPRWQILQPEASLLHLCAKPVAVPEQVTGLRFMTITVGQVLVIWSDENIKSKCIYTYVVGYSPNNSTGPFQRVNNVDTIATISVISPLPQNGTSGDDLVRGYYAVRAIDYWKRPGPYSQPKFYSP